MSTYAEPTVERRTVVRRQADPATPDGLAWLVPLGRAGLAAIFLASGFNHFTSTYVGYATQAGVPNAGLLVPFSGVLALLGGLSVLLGFRARVGAWLLVVFLLPVTFFMHNFWALPDPAARAVQQANFFKNLGLLGGALLVAYWGAGPISFDAMRRHPPGD